MMFLELRGIGKRYGAVPALADIDIDVAKGSRTAIVGPSGSGKTTLLRLVAGFETPDQGRIVLDGQMLAHGPAAVPAYRRGIGFVPQDGALFPYLSVAGNIGFGLDRRMPGRDERILELMDVVALERSMRGRRPHELSGGQQQRVALARALARRPGLMLFDEPFSALDTGLRETMRKAVAEVLRATGITAILVTHDQAEALSFADQVAVLRAGRLMQAGTPRQLYLRPVDGGTAAFIGNTILLRAEVADGWADCALGRIAADTAGRGGTVEIMLRPEQVQLIPVETKPSANGAGGPDRYAEVTSVAFGGASCLVGISILGHAGGSHCHPATSPAFVISTASMHAPDAGAIVRVVVRGKAHVLDRRGL